MHTETLMSTQIISGEVYSNFKSSLAGKFSLVIYFYESKSDTLKEEPVMINYPLLEMILPKFFCKSDASKIAPIHAKMQSDSMISTYKPQVSCFMVELRVITEMK